MASVAVPLPVRRRSTIFYRACSWSRTIRSLSSSSESSSRSNPADTTRHGGGGNGEDGVSHVPVLIVGAGPVGLVLSMLLTKLGVKCAILEKRLAFSRHPQAHFINNRTMEIFRKLDGLAEDIQLLQPPVDLWRKFIYCTSLSGSVLGSVDHMQPQVSDKVPSPVSVAHFSQYKLVNLLLQKLLNLGFSVSFPNQSDRYLQEKIILMGCECVSVNSFNEGIVVGTSYSKEGKMERREFSCSILVGCDGAGSTVRRILGISLKGERDLQKLVSVHFLSKDLGQYLLHERPGMLFFIFNPDAIGVLVAHDLNEGEFVLQIPFYPPQQRFEDFSSKVCKQIIIKLVGWEPADLEVVDIKPWVMHAEVAENYVSCNNRVILAGDAAHRFPPAGGFGMNTGIQDAHNIAWKISSLLGSIASASIIQTYEKERKPIAIFNTALSVQNYKAAMSVPTALGLDPTIANSVHQAINSRFGSLLPSALQKKVLEGIFSIGLAQLSNSILNENNPLGSLRLSRLKKIFDEGKSLQLQFPAEDLGFCYEEGALIGEIGKRSSQREVLDIGTSERRGTLPSAKPGSRLPHMQVKALKQSSTEDNFSTLDLIPGDSVLFALVIAPTNKSYDLARAALRMAEGFNVLLKICVIWPQGSFDKHANGSEFIFGASKNYIDVEEVKDSSSDLWWKTFHATRYKVMLVRPDDHIAWMAESNMLEDGFPELKRVFSVVLGLK